MNDAAILFGLLIVSIALGILLAFISMALVGRTAGDLERQRERGITGVPRIQAWVNLRSHLNRVAFGVVFVVINVMLAAGAPDAWRMWTNRTLWTLLLISFVVMTVLDWRAERAQIRLAMREQAAARALVAVPPPPEPVAEPVSMDSVDIATIQPSAAQAIADAQQNREG